MTIRSLYKFSLCLGLGCLFFARLAGAEDAEELYRQGNKKLQAGEFAAAIDAYNQALAIHPTGVNAYINRAIARVNLKDPNAALADLALAIQLAPEAGDPYRVRAYIRSQAEDYPEAINDLDTALDHNPKDIEALAMRAEYNAKSGNDDGALRDATRALELQPDLVPALYIRSQVRGRRGESAAALADLDLVLKAQPNAAEALRDRAQLKFDALDFPAALADARAAAAVAPKDGFIARLIGYSLFATGTDDAAAVAALEKAAEIDPTNAVYPLLCRHFALIRQGKPDQRLAKAWPEWKDEPWGQVLAQFALGQLTEEQLEAKLADQSEEDLRKGMACEAHFYIGLVRRQAGDKSTARLRFQSARDTGMTTYIEYVLAGAELKRR